SGDLTVGSGATFQPGSGSAGSSASVNGNLTLQPGANYAVNISPSAASRANVSGSATVNGANVQVLGGSGNYAASTQYTILNAAGGVGGTFDSVSSDLAFLTPSLSYDPNDVYLTMQRNQASFASVADTSNQEATGGAIESMGNTDTAHPIYAAALNLSAPQARNAFDQLSGEIHSSAQTAMVEDTRFVRDATIDRLRDTQGGAGTPQTAITSGNPNESALWFNTFGSWGAWRTDGNAGKMTRSIGGLVVGVDSPVASNARIGVVGGYGRSNLHSQDNAALSTVNEYTLGLYGGANWGDLALRSGAAYTWNNLSTDRRVLFPGYSDNLSNNSQAGAAQAYAELGYGINAGGLAVEPYVNVAYVNLAKDAFVEQGGAAALVGNKTNTDTTTTTLGVHASTNFDLGNASAKLKATLGWRRAFDDLVPQTMQAFADGSSTSFMMAGVPIAKDAGVVGLGVDFALSPETTIGVSYNGQFSKRASDNGAKVDFKMRF
ncbi:MAG: autotransporter domain-containing protein, partial [Burkholderiaceae bacterium]|nr:autotransporter domain-containing protein [Burkholderiaceae bacterium]